MQASKLVMYSYGVVAANKPLSSLDIEVTPMEEVTMTDGELTDNLSSANTKGKDADGAAFETTTNSAATVTARWLPFSSNRKTAPDVRRGEKVAIWKFADADKYYWSELEYDAKLRKLETVVYVFSNTRNESADATPETTYFVEISTHNKLIHVHTSTSDGEPFGYDFFLNTKEGTFQFRDTIENVIFLDSSAKRIVMKNAAGSFFDLFAENLSINVVNNLNIKVGGNMTTNVGGNQTTKVGGNYVMNSGPWKTTTPKASFVTPTLSTSAMLKVGSSLATGTAGGGGDTTIGGRIDVKGNIAIIGSLTASGTGAFSGSVSAPNI